MPLYEYRCPHCGRTFELIQKFNESPPETCPFCRKPGVIRLMGVPSLRFKGSGWYITDYGNGHSSAGAKATSDNEPEGGTKSESSKPATKDSKTAAAGG